MSISGARNVINADENPINENWLRIVRASRENRPHDIVRLSGNQYTFEQALQIIKAQTEYDEEEKRLEALVKPFAYYPQEGRALLGSVGNGTCRRGYGLRFMQVTGQTACAYCGLDFAASYRNWLQMALDHVVPTKTGTAKNIQADWLNDSSNKVLACGTCNGFQNRYQLDEAEVRPVSLEEFYQLRDRVFLTRKGLVKQSHVSEEAFYNKKPWASTGKA